MVYDDVRRLARRQMAGERGDHTLQGTALVNEAFIRLSGQRVFQWQNREQFLSLAAQVMRRVLVDYARQRGAQRRGDGAKKVEPARHTGGARSRRSAGARCIDDERVDVLAIDSALTKLHQIDAPQSRIVELRYFGGLTLEETASVAGFRSPPSSANGPWLVPGCAASWRPWMQTPLDDPNLQ